MANPFDGIISDDLKLLYYNLIEALINGTKTPCKIYYGVTSYEDCPLCSSSPIGNKSGNVHLSGSRVPFHSMSGCPNCNGDGKIPVETTEDIDLAVIWNYKGWIPTNIQVNSPDGMVQTVSRLVETLPQIKTAKHIIIGTDIEAYGQHKFTRFGEPNIAGFGGHDFLITFWKKA